MPKSSVEGAEVLRIRGKEVATAPDLLAVEEPMEIRIGFGPATERQQKSIAVTMRTPGHDLDLAAGFLFTEGIIDHPDQVRRIEHCLNVKKEEEVGNVVRAEIAPGLEIDLEKLQRHFYTTSSCGVCGKSSIEAIGEIGCQVYPEDRFRVPYDLIQSLPELIRGKQTIFQHTGGIHATAFFNEGGELLKLREDVGRHNAMDKVIGAAFMRKEIPLENTIALCSGRLGFELVQKALRAGVPILCAVGAPSNLAVKLATEFGMTLVGFVREGRFNVYSRPNRIISPDPRP